MLNITITGGPGSGKSSVAYAIRHVLRQYGLATTTPDGKESHEDMEIQWRPRLATLKHKHAKIEIQDAREALPEIPLNRLDADLVKTDMETLGNAFTCRGRRLDPTKMEIHTSLYNGPTRYVYDGLPLDSPQVQHLKTDSLICGVKTQGWGIPPAAQAFRSLRRLDAVEKVTAENHY